MQGGPLEKKKNKARGGGLSVDKLRGSGSGDGPRHSGTAEVSDTWGEVKSNSRSHMQIQRLTDSFVLGPTNPDAYILLRIISPGFMHYISPIPPM